MSKFISWDNTKYTEQSYPTPGFEYTVFSTSLDEDTKKNLEAYLKTRSAHKLKNISYKSFMIVLLMGCLAVVRQEYYPMQPLYQFISSIILVIVGGIVLYNEGYYEFDFNNTGSFEVLDKNREKVSTIKKDYRDELDTKIIQIFFGLFIALAFFFTQVTVSYSDSDKKEISGKL
ncbi:MAG TPA: hypothetical protein EYG81_00630 [Archaeoglobus profundus]|nr:hypothetical protein [Archaeoglobus profundus]